jgi:VanZ family protein
VLYTVLGVLLVFGRHWNGGSPPWPVLAGVGLLLAVLDEWHQSWVPGRTPAAGDVAADALGLLLGGVAAGYALRSLPSGASRTRRNR